jgi:hypothetical protein
MSHVHCGMSLVGAQNVLQDGMSLDRSQGRPTYIVVGVTAWNLYLNPPYMALR